MPQVTSVACGFWVMDGDELRWGMGFLGLHPVTLGHAGGDRERVTQ